MKRIPKRVIKFRSLSKAEKIRRYCAFRKIQLGKIILMDLKAIASNVFRSMPSFDFVGKADSNEIARRIVELTNPSEQVEEISYELARTTEE